jgi:hypothetical protein
MANPMYGQNKFDNSADAIIGDNGEAYIKRNVISMGATTAETSLTAAQTGSLIVLNSTASQIQVINLPTILPEDIGTYYDFCVTVIGNSGAAGSYTINTGGHATDPSSATKGYDDFIGTLAVLDGAAEAAADKTSVLPASGEGTMVLADDTTNANIAVGANFRLTAVGASVIGTASSDVWLCSGLLLGEATGFVTTNLFTAP